jgi:hypothetical protein
MQTGQPVIVYQCAQQVGMLIYKHKHVSVIVPFTQKDIFIKPIEHVCYSVYLLVYLLMTPLENVLQLYSVLMDILDLFPKEYVFMFVRQI